MFFLLYMLLEKGYFKLTVLRHAQGYFHSVQVKSITR